MNLANKQTIKERYIKQMNDIQEWKLLYWKLKLFRNLENTNNTFLKTIKTWNQKTVKK